jgi:hypothetical protein
MSEYEKKWYTKEDYLQYHCFDKYEINKKDWWYSITRSLDQIPECSNCKKDTDKLMNNVNQSKISLLCTINCLWFEWFDIIRKFYATKVGKKLTYYNRHIILS